MILAELIKFDQKNHIDLLQQEQVFCLTKSKTFCELLFLGKAIF